MTDKGYFGSVEAGGTKIVCAIGFNSTIKEKVVIKTTTPKATLDRVISFFKTSLYTNELNAIALGFFGPVEVNPQSRSYGRIGNTPKPGWSGINVITILNAELSNISLVLVTDVELAALGEKSSGSAKEFDDFLYLTVGTGIGGCMIRRGDVLRGRSHSELGHISVEKMPNDDFKGNCKYHQNSCLEGCASGSATVLRQKSSKHDLEPLEVQAWYLGRAILSYIYIFSPPLIVLGGGSLENLSLLNMVKENILIGNAEYLDLNRSRIDDFVIKSTLSGDAAIIGGFYLAEKYYLNRKHSKLSCINYMLKK